MHQFTPLITRDEWTSVHPIAPYRFTDALDVIEYLKHDPFVADRTTADAWHLDDEGRLQCASRCSSLCTLEWWADDPSHLLMSRAQGLEDGGCADRWVLIDPRSTTLPLRPMPDAPPTVAFHMVRAYLACVGVTLVDAIVIDDQYRWWSMHEELTGTTRWPDPLRLAAPELQ